MSASTRFAIRFACALTLCACGDSGPTTSQGPASPNGNADNTNDSSRDDGADFGNADDPAVDDAGDLNSGTVDDDRTSGDPGDLGSGASYGDRCLAANCGPAVLPEQREIEFLSEDEDGWRHLIHADWELAPNAEGYRCVRKTIPQDVYITAFSHQRTVGTHHTVLVVEENPSEPDGVTVCDVNAFASRRLQGSGAGENTDDVLPEGVAMKVLAGEQLLMNLHLFNVSDEPMSGTSGVLVKAADGPSAIEHEAEVSLAGPLHLVIPPGESTQGGRCTFGQPVTIFAVGPHMHQLGAHIRVTAHSSIEGTRVLHDAPFVFSDQLVYSVQPIRLAAGDHVAIDCTYHNDSDRTVSWGDSSLDEMCFAGLSYYPSVGMGTFPCTN